MDPGTRKKFPGGLRHTLYNGVLPAHMPWRGGDALNILFFNSCRFSVLHICVFIFLYWSWITIKYQCIYGGLNYY